MSSISSMPVFVDSYLADTTHLSTEEHGAYLLLLMAMWQRNGSVPDDDKDNARMTGLSLTKWKRTKIRLANLLQIEGGEITQKRLKKEYKYVQEKREKNKQNGALGGRPKINKNNDLTKANGYVSVNPNHNRNESPSTSTYLNKETNKERKEVEVVSWDQVSPTDIHLQRPDDPLSEYTEGELAMLNVEFDLLDIEGELTSLVDWAWNKGIVNDNERKRKIHSILKKKQLELEAGRALLDRPPAAPVSKEALENLNKKRRPPRA